MHNVSTLVNSISTLLRFSERNQYFVALDFYPFFRRSLELEREAYDFRATAEAMTASHHQEYIPGNFVWFACEG